MSSLIFFYNPFNSFDLATVKCLEDLTGICFQIMFTSLQAVWFKRHGAINSD